MADKTHININFGVFYRDKNGKPCDDLIHEEMLSVDDYAMRVLSAKRAIKEFGFSREAAEIAYDVKLDDSLI